MILVFLIFLWIVVLILLLFGIRRSPRTAEDELPQPVFPSQ